MEKGWDRIYASGSKDPEEIKEIEEKLPEHPHYQGLVENPNDTPELKKTPEEIKVIEAVAGAIDKTLEHMGLAKIGFDIDRIHVVDPEIFQKTEKFQERLAGRHGVEAFRHVNIQRAQSDELVFKYVLAHEMSHSVGAKVLGVKDAEDVDLKLPEKILLFLFDRKSLKEYREMPKTILYTRQAGFAYHYLEKPGKLVTGFSGLDEATTELFATSVREHLITSETPKEDVRRMETIMYEPHVLVLRKIMELLMPKMRVSKKRERAIATKIFSSFIAGDYSFLKDLESKHKGIVKALREMDVSSDDALEFAKKMGFEDLASEIQDVMNREAEQKAEIERLGIKY